MNRISTWRPRTDLIETTENEKLKKTSSKTVKSKKKTLKKKKTIRKKSKR